MSSQKGSITRNRPQKHQNSVAFKNTLHDTSHRTKSINNTRITNVCIHCKEVIEWKIKYKKYKPLSQAKTCVRCGQKTVKAAYHVMCPECARKSNSCAKCCKSNVEICPPNTQPEEVDLTPEMRSILKTLSERKRRTFVRFMEKKKNEIGEESNTEDITAEMMDKLKSLAVDTGSDDFNFSDENDGVDDECSD